MGSQFSNTWQMVVTLRGHWVMHISVTTVMLFYKLSKHDGVYKVVFYNLCTFNTVTT